MVLLLIHSFLCSNLLLGHVAQLHISVLCRMTCSELFDEMWPHGLHLTPEIENKMDSDKCTFRHHHAMLKRMIHRKQHYDHRLCSTLLVLLVCGWQEKSWWSIFKDRGPLNSAFWHCTVLLWSTNERKEIWIVRLTSTFWVQLYMLIRPWHRLCRL